MRSQSCHELNIIISITITFIEIDCISISALRSFAMQLPFCVVVCWLPWVWLRHSLHPCLALCSFATHVYSLGFAVWSFADQLLLDQLIIGFLAFAFSTLNLTFTPSRFWISYWALSGFATHLHDSQDDHVEWIKEMLFEEGRRSGEEGMSNKSFIAGIGCSAFACQLVHI